MHRIGLLAEDESDVKVAAELIRKIAHHSNFVIRHFVGHGSGKLRGKCRQWAQQLRRQGCTLLIVMHDLDTRQVTQLRTELAGILHPCPIVPHLIVIPVREIEAWLLCDQEAIRKALALRLMVPRTKNPEALMDPKRVLRDLILSRSGGKKRYVIEHNHRISQHVQVANLRRCPSFLPLEAFIRSNVTA